MLIPATMANAKVIKFDVMLGGRFIATMRMPAYLADDVDGYGRFGVTGETISKYVVAKRPTLKGKPFNICF